jgi:HEAT repeat protein
MVAVAVDYERFVLELGIEHRAKAAVRTLMEAGTSATPAVRAGLRHPDPRIRERCCVVLDRFLDEDAVPELKENLRHPDPRVRLMAIHAPLRAIAARRARAARRRRGWSPQRSVS